MDLGSGEWRSLMARWWERDTIRELWLATYNMVPEQAEMARAEVIRKIERTRSWHLLGWVNAAQLWAEGYLLGYDHVRVDSTHLHAEIVLNLPVSADLPERGTWARRALCAAIISEITRTYQISTEMKQAVAGLGVEGVSEMLDDRSLSVTVGGSRRFQLDVFTEGGAWRQVWG